MKFFFNTSIRSDDDTKKISRRIYEWLCKKGYTPTYNCFANGCDRLLINQEVKESEILYTTAIKGLSNSDIVILEVSTNSFTQGYILQKALEMAKPVIVLHQKGKYSVFVKGIQSSLLQTVEYEHHNLEKLLRHAITYAIENLESRFNFFLPQEINTYLKWMSKKKQLSKSAVVREVLREHMSSNQEYSN